MWGEAPECCERSGPNVHQTTVGRGSRPLIRVGRVVRGRDPVTQFPGDHPAAGWQPRHAPDPVVAVSPLPGVQDPAAVEEPDGGEILAGVVGETQRRAGAEWPGGGVVSPMEGTGVLARGEPSDQQQAEARRHADGELPTKCRSYPSGAAAFRRCSSVFQRGYHSGRRRHLDPRKQPMTVVPLLLAVLLQQPAAPPAPQAPARVPPSVGDTSPFRRLELPAPNLIREGSGMPGPRYWQQRADYTIQVSLDTAAHTAGGRETIRYTNNSPDTLRYAWLQVDQNIYREDSRGGAINPADARWAARGFQGGYTITAFDAVRSAAGAAGRPASARRSLTTTVNGTLLRADLDRPLPPDGTATWEIAFSFQIPEHGSDRMGR